MKQNNIEEGRLAQGGQGLGTITEEMVRRRASEIAVINGRPKDHILTGDLEQARRELEGEERLNPATSAAEAIPEGERWAVPKGSTGRRTPPVPAPDEQTNAEKLVEEGMAEAEHEQQVEATRESLRKEKRP